MILRYVDSLNNEVNWKLNRNTLKGDDLKAETTRAQLALPTLDVHEAPRKITEEEREFKAYRTLRDEWANARHEGARKARAAKVRPHHFFQCSSTDVQYLGFTEGRGGCREEEVNSLPHPSSSFIALLVIFIHAITPHFMYSKTGHVFAISMHYATTMIAQAQRTCARKQTM